MSCGLKPELRSFTRLFSSKTIDTVDNGLSLRILLRQVFICPIIRLVRGTFLLLLISSNLDNFIAQMVFRNSIFLKVTALLSFGVRISSMNQLGV